MSTFKGIIRNGQVIVIGPTELPSDTHASGFVFGRQAEGRDCQTPTA
jgi:hypothetical protein